jgi:hypothetical protein
MWMIIVGVLVLCVMVLLFLSWGTHQSYPTHLVLFAVGLFLIMSGCEKRAAMQKQKTNHVQESKP